VGVVDSTGEVQELKSGGPDGWALIENADIGPLNEPDRSIVDILGVRQNNSSRDSVFQAGAGAIGGR
jgi:hypothetical protein